MAIVFSSSHHQFFVQREYNLMWCKVPKVSPKQFQMQLCSLSGHSDVLLLVTTDISIISFLKGRLHLLALRFPESRPRSPVPGPRGQWPRPPRLPPGEVSPADQEPLQEADPPDHQVPGSPASVWAANVRVCGQTRELLQALHLLHVSF